MRRMRERSPSFNVFLLIGNLFMSSAFAAKAVPPTAVVVYPSALQRKRRPVSDTSASASSTISDCLHRATLEKLGRISEWAVGAVIDSDRSD
mmetsp:Transcript_119428/g.382785  ORF Transcript_119428/g.382785 Transcript_119428/m.382785 type:complete len:92 (-) Transcript_119428:165-440(-)